MWGRSSSIALLQQEVVSVQRWLDQCQAARRPMVALEPSGETLSVTNFPLPDKYRPDHVSLALVVRDFPTEPPKGIYLLSDASNRQLIGMLRQRFNVFQGTAYHGAPAIRGFEWICVGYLNGWHYDTRAPHKGDNIFKMLLEFWRLLENT